MKPEDKEEIRHALLFSFRSGDTPKQACDKICRVFPNGITIQCCRKWYRRFRIENYELGDSKRSGRPPTINRQTLKDVLNENRRYSTRSLANVLGCSNVAIWKILKKDGYVWKQARIIPLELSIAQREARVRISQALLTRFNECNFLKQIVTSDEKWLLYDNCKASKQWVTRDDETVPVVRASMRSQKVLICVWWSATGLVHFEVLEYGQTINAVLYTEQLDRMMQKLKVNKPALVNRKKILLLHDNATPHTASMTKSKLIELGIEVLPHPPYSPDVAPTDYAIFRSLECYSRYKKFNSVDDVKRHLIEFFNSKPESFYKKAINQLVPRWKLVIQHDGNYFDEKKLKQSN